MFNKKLLAVLLIAVVGLAHARFLPDGVKTAINDVKDLLTHHKDGDFNGQCQPSGLSVLANSSAGQVVVSSDNNYIIYANLVNPGASLLGSLEVASIQNPKSPSIVGSVNGAYFGVGGTFGTNVIAVACNSQTNQIHADVISFATPSSPSILGSTTLTANCFNPAQKGPSGQFAVIETLSNGQYAYALIVKFTGQPGPKESDQEYYLGTIDISTPSSPKFLGFVSWSGQEMQDMILSSDEKNLYIADFSFGLTVLSLANPASPAFAKEITWQWDEAQKIEQNPNNGLLYILDYDSVVAVLNVTSGQATGNFFTYDIWQTMKINGNILVLAGDGGAFNLIDISNPNALSEIGSISNSAVGNIASVSFSNDNKLAFAAGPLGTWIIDTSSCF